MSLHFKYQIPTWRNLVGITVCIAGAIGMGFLASSNHKGLRLFHLVTFSPETASGLYWAFAAVLVLSAVMLMSDVGPHDHASISNRTREFDTCLISFFSPCGTWLALCWDSLLLSPLGILPPTPPHKWSWPHWLMLLCS